MSAKGWKKSDSGSRRYKFQTCSYVRVYMTSKHISFQAGPKWQFHQVTGDVLTFKELDQVKERKRQTDREEYFTSKNRLRLIFLNSYLIRLMVENQKRFGKALV